MTFPISNLSRYFARRSTIIALFLILSVSLGIRIYTLNQQGLLFIDEGTFIYRAKTFQLLADNAHAPMQQPSNYADKKIIWLLTILGVLNITSGAPVYIQIVSVVLGIISIFLTYIVAMKMYRSPPIGLLSAATLGLSTMHIFYSRSAMPEMMNMVWVLLMVCFYLRAKSDKAADGNIVMAGVMMSFAFLTDVFRAALMPLSLLLIELGVGSSKENKEKPNFVRLGVFALVTVLCTVALVQALWFLLKMQGIWLSPYMDIISSYMNQHTSSPINWTAVIYALSYTSTAEGWHYVGLAFIGLLFIRREKSTLLPFSIVLIYVVSWIFVDERAIRALTPVLPFVAIYIGVTLYHLNDFFKTRMRFVAFAGLGVLIALQVASFSKIYTYHSDLHPAMEYIKEKSPQARILMDSQSIAIAFDFNFSRYGQLTHQTVDDVRALNQRGFNYLITDFVKYAVNSVSKDGKIVLTPFVRMVESKCVPIKEYAHFNESLERWMLMEVNQYAEDVKWLDDHITDRTGRLRIYDLDRCLEKLEGM